MKKKIYLTRIFPAHARDLLQNAGHDVNSWSEDRPMTQEELIREAKNYNALLCTVTDRIDKKFLNECSHLDIISQFAVGYDNIDIPEASRLGIPIGFTPDVLSEATADVAFGLMISVSRKMFYLHKTVLNGGWHYFRPTANLGIELRDKILGIFGLGRIGMAMARRCKSAYNMKIIYHNRTPNITAEGELHARYVDFKTLLKESDVISVHCTLTNETADIFNKSAFLQMKSNAIFINTARGQVHNENDLIKALNTRQIWGAGLDVTNPEPMKINNPLLSMENVAILPHIGSGTVETRDKMAQVAADNIIGFYKEKTLKNIINKHSIKIL